MRADNMFRVIGWVGVVLGGVAAEAGEPGLDKELIASGLNRPVFITHAPGDFDRLFIVEQRGVIKLHLGHVLPTPFLDIDNLVPGIFGNTEVGLLGLAFHPDYADNGYFYVNYTNLSGSTVIARYQVTDDPNIADPASAQILMIIAQPQSNHNGGWIAFGPDGYLYIATGDGGNFNDQGPGHSAEGNAQDTTSNLLGKILRIDVDGGTPYAIPPDNPFVGIAGDDEIWAYGLRNPWRPSFDRETGDLYLADVGQNAREEISFQPASSPGGENYGWRCREGDLCTGLSGCDCNSPALVEPIHHYVNGTCTGGGFSLTGGYVYRGCAMPELAGTYFFADFVCQNIWSFRYDGESLSEFQSRNAELATSSVASFGEDAYGELYIVSRGGATTGQIFRIVPAGGPAQDCNENFVADACDILDGSSDDANGNGILDECEADIAIVSSVPPDGAIDARQPSDPDGTNPAGWSQIALTFDGDATGLLPEDFAVSVDPAGAAPTVTAVDASGSVATLTFDGPIPVAHWTIVAHLASGTDVRIGYLPSDVTNDRTAGANDVLALIDALNGVGDPLAGYQTDVDRSGAAAPPDVLRTIDLLNGAGVYDVYLGVTLPD